MFHQLDRLGYLHVCLLCCECVLRRLPIQDGIGWLRGLFWLGFTSIDRGLVCSTVLESYAR